MRITYVPARLTTLVCLVAISVGCSATRPFSLASLHAPSMSSHSETAPASNKNHSPSIVPPRIVASTSGSQAKNGLVNAPADSKFQNVSYSPANLPLSTQTLTTLGPRDNFHDLINNSNGTVLIDFYADWCGPCRRQGKILHDLEPVASQNGASIIKVNIDHHPELASQFDVSSLPTLMLFKDGKVIDRRTGLADRNQIADLLSR